MAKLNDEQLTAPGARYAWIIDSDRLADSSRNDAGTMGPRNITPAQIAALQASPRIGLRFRMRDDDQEIYYAGRIIGIGDSAASIGEEGFAPLDDFGAPNAGCTSIEYRNGAGQWEIL